LKRIIVWARTHAHGCLPAADAKKSFGDPAGYITAREFSFPALKPVVEVAIRMAGLLLPFERGYC